MPKIKRPALIIVGIAFTIFTGFFVFLRFSVPGEKAMLEKISALEKTQPTSCPEAFEREGLLVELTRVALAYKSNANHKEATPYFLRVVELQKQLCGANYSGVIGPMTLLAENYDLEGSAEKAALVRKEIQRLKEELQ